jgi:hypothetical protein
MEIIIKLFTLGIPNNEDIKLIQKHGLIKWVLVFFIKILFILLLLWFVFKYLGLKISI